jgi:hypothetical protein
VAKNCGDFDVAQKERESEYGRPYHRLFERFRKLFGKNRVARRWTCNRCNGRFLEPEAENCDWRHDEVDDERGNRDGNGTGFAKQVAEDSRSHEWCGRRGRSQCRQYALA